MTTSRPRSPKKPEEPDSGGMSQRTANIITGVVTAVWAVSVIAGIFKVNGYESPEGLNTIFTIVVGGAFVLRNKAKD